MSLHFYEDIVGFSHFNDLVHDEHYHQVPADWWVVITDVMGSTQAVQEGRYKDVNTIGAATLVALRIAIPDISIPFVFGGDGASALIPGEYRSQAAVELSALRTIAKTRFGLALRATMVSVSELTALAGPILVGKFLLGSTYPLAVFRGGALSAADELMKRDVERYEVSDSPGAETDLRDLSCRWKEIPSAKGCVLAVLAIDPQGNGEAMLHLLQEMDRILEPDTQSANPVRRDRMSYRGLWQMMTTDRLHPNGFMGWARRMIGILVAYSLFRLGFERFSDPMKSYTSAIPTHCDFRKFDDVLRMIVDCDAEQAQAIENLRRPRETHGLAYGLHRNQAALMTCYVPGFGHGEHVHFVDGADGGYTMAARQLKAQLAEA